jgi:hypothetical protein
VDEAFSEEINQMNDKPDKPAGIGSCLLFGLVVLAVNIRVSRLKCESGFQSRQHCCVSNRVVKLVSSVHLIRNDVGK